MELINRRKLIGDLEDLQFSSYTEPAKQKEYDVINRILELIKEEPIVEN